MGYKWYDDIEPSNEGETEKNINFVITIQIFFDKNIRVHY